MEMLFDRNSLGLSAPTSTDPEDPMRLPDHYPTRDDVHTFPQLRESLSTDLAGNSPSIQQLPFGSAAKEALSSVSARSNGERLEVAESNHPVMKSVSEQHVETDATQPVQAQAHLSTVVSSANEMREDAGTKSRVPVYNNHTRQAAFSSISTAFLGPRAGRGSKPGVGAIETVGEEVVVKQTVKKEMAVKDSLKQLMLSRPASFPFRSDKGSRDKSIGEIEDTVSEEVVIKKTVNKKMELKDSLRQLMLSPGIDTVNEDVVVKKTVNKEMAVKDSLKKLFSPGIDSVNEDVVVKKTVNTEMAVKDSLKKLMLSQPAPPPSRSDSRGESVEAAVKETVTKDVGVEDRLRQLELSLGTDSVNEEVVVNDSRMQQVLSLPVPPPLSFSDKGPRDGHSGESENTVADTDAVNEEMMAKDGTRQQIPAPSYSDKGPRDEQVIAKDGLRQQIPLPSYSDKGPRDENSGESEDTVADTLSQPAPKSHKRPGVILLGRGNSFSLGRSEVLILHNARPTRRKTVQPRSSLPANGIGHRESSSSSSLLADEISKVNFNSNEIAKEESLNHNGPSPPQLSNLGLVHPGAGLTTATTSGSVGGRPFIITGNSRTTTSAAIDGTDVSTTGRGLCSSDNPNIFEDTNRSSRSNGSQSEETDSNVYDDLEALWARAELVMAGKQRAVLEVLAQFGVGDGGGDSAEQGEEEEDRVWNIVESKVPAKIT